MIKHHKVLGVPGPVIPGEEHIWFSQEGAIFAADHAGHPIPMGMGFKQVNAIPTGKPPAPGLMRYVTSNRKYYFSTEVNWLELQTQAQPGSSHGPGYAGGVILIDSAQNYIAGDVEGALAEVADRLKPFFGQGFLPELSGNAFTTKQAGDWRISNLTSNRPSGVASLGWLTQRRDSAGNTYGLIVDSSGGAFTRYNSNYVKLANSSDLDSMRQAINDIKSDTNQTVGGMTLRVGPGLVISDGGQMSKNPLIQLDPKAAEGEFVKKSGDTMMGTLNINGDGQFKMLSNQSAVMSLQSNLVQGRLFQFVVRGEEFKASDQSTGFAPFHWNASTKKLSINYLDPAVMSSSQINDPNYWGKGVNMKGPLQVENFSLGREPFESRNSQFALYVDNAKENIAIFRGGESALAVRNSQTSIKLEAVDNTNTQMKNMIISGIHSRDMSTFKVLATHSRFNGHVHTKGSLSVGASHDDPYGTVGLENQIQLYPRTKKDNVSYDQARRRMVQFAYQAHRDALEIYGYQKNSDSFSNTGWTKLNVSVEATKFNSTSSERFKEDIRPLEDGALELVKNVDVFKYKFKDSLEKEDNVGFIIERGVPEVAKTDRSIDSYAMVGFLWKAVQELTKKVEELEGH